MVDLKLTWRNNLRFYHCYHRVIIYVFSTSLQETSFGGNKAVTRKVSTTSVKSMSTPATAQVVKVTRNHSGGPATTAHSGGVNQPPKTVNGNNDLSPWLVSSGSADTAQTATTTANKTVRRVMLTTEL